MARKKRESFFWVSYSDLMTSLFFIMLLLFVLSSAGMYLSKRATEDQLRKIEEIQAAVNRLPKQYFEEDSINKRWVLSDSFAPHFARQDYHIQRADTARLVEVGRALLAVVDELNELKRQPEYADMGITYLVVIEGMASKDSYWDNDNLSYMRALHLYYLWNKKGISFENSQCEVQVAGSGVRGLGRYTKPEEEYKNQRIIIQIIPKIGSIK